MAFLKILYRDRSRPSLQAIILGCVVALAIFGCGEKKTPVPDETAGHTSYEQLLSFFEDWRAFQKPKVSDGVPDYSASAMQTQYQEFAAYKSRLAAIDTSGWTISQRVDYHLVLAEMNGLDFEHRVHRQWARNPAFYAQIFSSQSDTPAHEGPEIHGAIELWQYDYPLNDEDAAELTAKIQAVPSVLNQAKLNLVENCRDLWQGSIRRMNQQVDELSEYAKQVSENVDLVAAVEAAGSATLDFVTWLEAEAPTKTGPSGVGVDNYNWYLKHVQLLPYTWQDEVTLMRRELARAMTSLKLEEHRNRNLPPAEPIASSEEHSQKFNAAVSEYLAFLDEQEIVPMRDYMDQALRERIGQFIPPDGYRHFFAQVDLRDPVVMRTHHYHWLELARMANEPHASPIRQVPQLYNIFSGRSEGLATGVEEMLMHAGLFDNRPRARELIWILLAQRAARALGSLHMHSNDWTIEQAVEFACKWTPRGWLQPEGRLVWFEQDLYLKQPFYGSSYVTGKAEIEKLLAERALQQGDAFTLKGFMDEVNKAGVIPVSLVRWELTGLDDEIMSMLK